MKIYIAFSPEGKALRAYKVLLRIIYQQRVFLHEFLHERCKLCLFKSQLYTLSPNRDNNMCRQIQLRQKVGADIFYRATVPSYCVQKYQLLLHALTLA